MSEENKNEKNIKCNFCGMPQSQAGKLISGPNVYICDECVKTAYNLIFEPDNKPVQIVREITLPQEFQQAGFSLFCYLPNILRNKLPGVTFSTHILFKENTVYLYIITSEQVKEAIEALLKEFSLVIQGISKPESFLEDSEQIAELKHRLHMTSVELGQLEKFHKKQDGIKRSSGNKPMKLEAEKLHERISWILRKEIENIDGLFD